MKRTYAIIAAALVAAVTLVGCSSDSNKEAEDMSTPTSGMAVEGLPEEIADELSTKVDVEPGQAVVPGSIPWSQVSGLSAQCEEAVQPVRDLMAKYASALLITDANDAKVLGDTNRAAQENCTPREYATWYGDEFNGWLNAATTSE